MNLYSIANMCEEFICSYDEKKRVRKYLCRYIIKNNNDENNLPKETIAEIEKFANELSEYYPSTFSELKKALLNNLSVGYTNILETVKEGVSTTNNK